MGFAEWLKDLLSTKKELLEELADDKLANEKWIEHYFKIGFEKLPKETQKDFDERIGKLHGQLFYVVFGRQGIVYKNQLERAGILTEKLKKSVTIKVIEPTKKHYEFLIRFSDYSKKDFKEGGIQFREKKQSKKEDYLFSPFQELILSDTNILRDIEADLMRFLQIEPPEVMKAGKIMKRFSLVDGKPYYEEFDGIQFLGYPIEKRIELYAINPQLQGEIFPTTDKFYFKDFIEEILEKKKDDKHMEKLCEKVEALLEKYKVEL